MWCFLHSVLIDPKVAGYIKGSGKIPSHYYRLFYNLVSFTTLIPLVLLSSFDMGDAVFSWSGIGLFIRAFLLIAALYCFWAGAKGYDLRYFLGLQQIRDGKERVLLGEDDSFSEAGILGVVRHPWYLGSLLLIWSIFQTYYQKNLAVVLILTMYLILGAYLEEKKIVAEFGDRYRQYQQRVSMFIPLKWLKRKWQEKFSI